MRYRHLLVADFRREYGLSAAELDDLDAVEFVQLLTGISRSSRLTLELSSTTHAAPATVPAMRPAPSHQTSTEFVQALRRHRGRVVDLTAGVS